MHRALFLLVAGALLVDGVLADGGKGEEPPVEVYTNADLPVLPSGASTGVTPPAQPLPAVVPASPLRLPSIGEHRDRSGRGEGWWRHRAAELEIAIYRAEYDAQAAHVAYLKGKVLTDRAVPRRSRNATRELLDLRAELEALPQELRRAGGVPGWLRRGSGAIPQSPLAAPTLEPAQHGAVLEWKPVRDARFYLVELQCSDCCGLIGACDLETLDVHQPRLTVPADARGTGRWRVRALDADGFGGPWSPWSDYAAGS